MDQIKLTTNQIPIVYINLDHRVDRREHMEAQLQKYGLVAERFSAIANPGFGIWGCGQSHMAVLKMAQSRGWHQVWILEDDFEFEISPEEFWFGYRNIVCGNDNLGPNYDANWDVFMGAYNLREKAAISETDSLIRILFAQTASCYIVRSHYFQKIIDLYESAMPKLLATGHHWIYANDVVWHDLQRDDLWIGPTKRWGKQLDGYSDNAQTVMKYDC